MSAELRTVSTPGLTIYAHVLNAAGKRWNGASFETYAAGDLASYGTSVPEQGSSGVYVGDFPSGITTAGAYEIIYFSQQGGAPAEGDPIVGTGDVEWNGSAAVAPVSAGAMTGQQFLAYVLRVFKRDDKDTEAYEAMTDAVGDMKREFEFDSIATEKDTTDTIAVLGEYKIDAESDLGLIIGDVIVREGTNSRTLMKLSKADFDRIYPNPAATNVVKARPFHWCYFGGQILLGPVPDKTTYTYHLSYTADAGEDITSATNAVPFSSVKTYRDTLRHRVLEMLFDGVENDQAARKHGALYERNMIMNIRAEKNKSGAIGMTSYNGCR